MRERRHIEREFGVPIAGEILARSLWTQTALKRLPEQGPLEWQHIFGRSAPVVLDLGCGNGRYLVHSAVWRPDHDHLGIDILPLVIRYATRRANQRGLGNIRFAVVGGHELLARYVPAGSVAEIHCYHPQPYYDRSQVHRRLITPAFLALVHQALLPAGLFFIQTDNPGYWRYVQEIVPFFFRLREQPVPWPDGPKGRTRREIITLRRGLPVFRAWGEKQDELTTSRAIQLAEALPPPVFDADSSLRQLDAMEAKFEGE